MTVDFTTTDWEFNLLDPEPVVELATKPSILPYISEPKAWEQYSNIDLYEIDKLVRSWLDVMSQDAKWCRTVALRRYTVSMVYEQCTGKKWDNSLARVSWLWSKVLAYYSSKMQKAGSINGKNRSKTIYTLSPKRYKVMPPYSLRLRLEWLSENGDVPTHRNMALPKDDLVAGHARNVKTEKNMQARRQRAKEIYNERYADRKH